MMMKEEGVGGVEGMGVDLAGLVVLVDLVVRVDRGGLQMIPMTMIVAMMMVVIEVVIQETIKEMILNAHLMVIYHLVARHQDL